MNVTKGGSSQYQTLSKDVVHLLCEITNYPSTRSIRNDVEIIF